MKRLHLSVATAALAALVTLAVWMQRGERPPLTVTVAAAADLRFVLEELTAEFGRQHPGLRLSVTYGSSGTFYAQLVNGAPFDVFLSADIDYPRQLSARELTRPGSEFTYAQGRIVVWVLEPSPLDIEARGLEALTDPAISHLALANPDHAPYGRAAEAAMRAGGILDRVRPKLVYGENISQALQFVQSGSAEAGIVALSLAVAPPVAGSGRYWLIPSDTHPPIVQGGAIMRAAANPDAAIAFRAFMLGDQARKLLARYGFDVPSTPDLQSFSQCCRVRLPPSRKASADRRSLGGGGQADQLQVRLKPDPTYHVIVATASAGGR